MGQPTQILERIQQGDSRAAEEFVSLVYDELRRLAAHKLAAESPRQTLQPTALVHEAWLRLGGAEQPPWANRRHFFAAAAEAMRRILVDRARRRLAAKRGAGLAPLPFDAIEIPNPIDNDDTLLRVHEALEKLAASEPEKAELVKLRYFVGATFEEAAEALGVSVPTCKNWWSYTRAWLSLELRSADVPPP